MRSQCIGHTCDGYIQNYWIDTISDVPCQNAQQLPRTSLECSTFSYWKIARSHECEFMFIHRSVVSHQSISHGHLLMVEAFQFSANDFNWLDFWQIFLSFQIMKDISESPFTVRRRQRADGNIHAETHWRFFHIYIRACREKNNFESFKCQRIFIKEAQKRDLQNLEFCIQSKSYAGNAFNSICCSSLSPSFFWCAKNRICRLPSNPMCCCYFKGCHSDVNIAIYCVGEIFAWIKQSLIIPYSSDACIFIAENFKKYCVRSNCRRNKILDSVLGAQRAENKTKFYS